MQSKNYEETLLYVLTKMLGADIINANYNQAEQLYLQGGMSGVHLITGIAETIDGEKLPYKVILKVQEKRRPPSDPDSWTREYKIYASDFYKNEIFNEQIRMLKCYHTEFSNDRYALWLEYADGVTGKALTLDNLEYIAGKFGDFQGRICSQPELLKYTDALCEGGFVEKYYEYQASENDVYLRSDECDLPKHLKKMLLNVYDNDKMTFEKFKKFPKTFFHGDFYISNIILKNDEVVLIDWGDGAGWGHIGEDIANLIVDCIDVKYWDEYYRRLIPAYLNSLSQYIDISALDNAYFQEMIIIRSGYDAVHWYKQAKSQEEKNKQITALQFIYDIGK